MNNRKYISISVFILLLLINITTKCGVAICKAKCISHQKQTSTTVYYDDIKLVSINFLF